MRSHPISWDKRQKFLLGAEQPQAGEQNCSSAIGVYQTGMEEAEAAEKGQCVRSRESITDEVRAMAEVTEEAGSTWNSLC